MSRLAFSKASLHRQTALLKRYRQYLPSLDLKRQQLMAEKNKARHQLEQTQAAMEQIRNYVAEQLPMLAVDSIRVEGLVAIDKVDVRSENRVGVTLPVLQQVIFKEQPYAFFCKPHWVDKYIVKQKEMLSLMVREQIEQRRLEALAAALKKVTQRVNLFDKVLIPRARQNIRKIQIFLSDAERAAVVRAKITKRKVLASRY